MIEYPPEFISLADIEKVRPWIEGALRYGPQTHTFEDVIEEVAENRATLWVFEKSAVVTQITTYPQITMLTFWLAGGNMKDMLQHEPGIVEWAKEHGCTGFLVPGRKGWLRVMHYLGYRPIYHYAFKGSAYHG